MPSEKSGLPLRRKVIYVLVGILLVLFLAEMLLRVFDPLGIYQMSVNLAAQLNSYVASPRGYVMYPGKYELRGWTATIDEHGNRVLPDAHAGACELAFIGDSITFGVGVNDAETFANIIAGEVAAHVTNTAHGGHNSGNILRTLNATDADGFVYVTVYNDDQPDQVVTDTQPRHTPYTVLATATYILSGLRGNAAAKVIDPQFAANMAQIAARDDVLMVTFDWRNAWADTLRAFEPELVTIPVYQGRVSYIDGHPNARGHAEIAAALVGHVRQFETRMCR